MCKIFLGLHRSIFEQNHLWDIFDKIKWRGSIMKPSIKNLSSDIQRLIASMLMIETMLTLSEILTVNVFSMKISLEFPDTIIKSLCIYNDTFIILMLVFICDQFKEDWWVNLSNFRIHFREIVKTFRYNYIQIRLYVIVKQK